MFKRERLSAHIQRAVAEELRRSFPGVYISVTEVDVAEGARHAHVWVSILADNREQVFAEILAMKGRLRAAIAKDAKLRRVPDMTIKLDERMQRAQEIGQL